MTEIEDLMGVWGAIDQTVVENPDAAINGQLLADVVGNYLGPYRDPAATGWFGEFTAWTDELGRENNYPTLDVALRNLADRVPRGRQRARRLHAVAVAARMFPALRSTDHDDHEALLGALIQPRLASDTDSAERLLALLCDDEVFPDLSEWGRLLVTAFDEGCIDHVMLRQASAPPCSGTLVMVQLPGDADPVPTLRTYFCTPALTLKRAKCFLEPSNWEDCSDFWCEMRYIETSSGGNPIYHEIVSVACDNASAWRAETDLEFRMYDLGDHAAMVSYNLSKPWQPGEMIKVDSGSLSVVERNGQVCVTTTKRVLFDHPFSGPALSVLSCVLGYGAVAEDLVFSCAAEPDGDQNAGTEFPGVELPEPQDGAPMADEPRSSPAGDDLVKGIVDEAVEATKACLDDCAKSCQSSFDKMVAGSYKTDDAVRDVTTMWMRMLRDGATAVNLGLRASQGAKARQAASTAGVAAVVPAEDG